MSYRKTSFERPFGPVGTFACQSCAITAAHVVVVRGFTEQLYGMTVGRRHMTFALRCVACAAERPLDAGDARQALASIGAKPEDAMPPKRLTQRWVLVVAAVFCIVGALAEAGAAFTAPSSALAGYLVGTAVFGILGWLSVRSLLRRREDTSSPASAALVSGQPGREQPVPTGAVTQPTPTVLGANHFPTTILPGQ